MDDPIGNLYLKSTYVFLFCAENFITCITQAWQDIAFFRGTGNSAQAGWIAAVTKCYKLVFSVQDDPWLFDLEKDPDELINFYKNPAYRDAIRTLVGQLLDYGKKFQDPRLNNPKLQTDLQQVIKNV